MMKEKLINILKLVIDFVKANLFLTVVGAFSVVVIAVLCIATFAMNEFIVPVALLVMIEAAMAMFLKKSELWLHGVVVIAQIVAGVVIERLPLTIMCAVVYVAATVALMVLGKAKKA